MLTPEEAAGAEDWRERPRSIRVRTKREAEERAAAEQVAYVRRLLWVNWLSTVVVRDRYGISPRAEGIVHVLPRRTTQGYSWEKDWLDPVWPVIVITHSTRATVESTHIFARSYCVDRSFGPLDELAQALWAPDYRTGR
jgi:hypothetical protein